MKTIYVILNGNLKMTAGKACSQTAHAVAKLDTSAFKKEYKNKVVVLEAAYSQMLNLQQYLLGAGIHYETYIDEGDFETPSFSMTAMAIEPLDESIDEEKIALFESFELYPKGHMSWRK